MENYKVQLKKSVAKELKSLPKKDIEKILLRIDGLCNNPRGNGCIKLSAQERYRIRQGIYRIIYEIKDTELIILVVKVAHRKDVYKHS